MLNWHHFKCFFFFLIPQNSCLCSAEAATDIYDVHEGTDFVLRHVFLNNQSLQISRQAPKANLWGEKTTDSRRKWQSDNYMADRNGRFANYMIDRNSRNAVIMIMTADVGSLQETTVFISFQKP